MRVQACLKARTGSTFSRVGLRPLIPFCLPSMFLSSFIPCLCLPPLFPFLFPGVSGPHSGKAVAAWSPGGSAGAEAPAQASWALKGHGLRGACVGRCSRPGPQLGSLVPTHCRGGSALLSYPRTTLSMYGSWSRSSPPEKGQGTLLLKTQLLPRR